MKATFALLVDNKIHNYVRKLAYRINKEYKTGFFGAQLPPHISLKQPFHIDDIEEVEEYFDSLAKSILPFEIFIPKVSVWNLGTTGCIFLEVEETSTLRNLHNRINKELSERFENTEAMFDGGDYRFHVTIALGEKPPEVYESFYEKLKAKVINLRYIAKEIVMFYYDDDNYSIGSFITYKILPLGC